jgi:hypothetical protein
MWAALTHSSDRTIRRSSKEAPVKGNIFNSKGIHVGVIVGREIFDRKGTKLYDLRGTNIYRLSGELVGHLNDASGTDKRLDKATDRLFA